MSLAFNLGTDPLTGRAIMNENIAISIQHSTNDLVYPSHRQVVCLALNEIGRRTKRGFVYWIEDDQHNEWQPDAPALFYIPYEWTKKDCKEFDDDPHELRARSARATARTAPMSPVLALHLKIEGKDDRCKSNGQCKLRSFLCKNMQYNLVTPAEGPESYDIEKYAPSAFDANPRRQKELPINHGFGHWYQHDRLRHQPVSILAPNI